MRCNDDLRGGTVCCDTALKGEVTAVLFTALQWLAFSCWCLLNTGECVTEEREMRKRLGGRGRREGGDMGGTA